ncbi:hypothetical protein JW926_13515 [Candidatus Sumerlaeota bacterium]|nr:hypothetical protein [Candidatus Sumerlaeota bacterium]
MFGSRKNREKGSILLIAIVVVSVISVGLVCSLAYQKDLGKMGNRRREQMRAFYVADIGVQRVIHWFNHPDEYTPDTVLFTKFSDTESYFDSSDQTRFISTVSVPSGLLPVVYDANNSYLGELVNLQLLPPDPTHDPISCIVKVQSVGKSFSGPPKTIMVYLNTSHTFNIECPAAIITDQTATWGGQFNIRWGQVWAKHNAILPNLAQTKKAFKDDPWLKLKVKETVYLNNANYADGTNTGSTTPLPETAPNYFQPWLLTDADLDEIYQHQTETAADAADPFFFPIFDYQLNKEYAITKGRYYGSDAAGDIYRDGIIDEAHKVTDLYAEFHIADADNGPYEFIFIDTIDKQPPALDGSNMCTLHFSGNTPHTKGVFYCANNVYLGGSGDPPDVTNAVDPNNSINSLNKVRHQGLFYVSGQFDQQGENTIYGSCVAGGGFGSGGCPEVYYDYRLKTGALMTAGSNVRRVLWRTY